MAQPVSPEIELVLLLSLPDPRPDDVGAMLRLLNTPLDWNQVLGMLTVHRVIGVAWHNVVRYAIQQRQTLPCAYFLKSLKVTAGGQRVMAEEQTARTAEVQRILQQAGVRSAVLKGSAVAKMAYPDPGMRTFNDNDLLVDRARLPDATAALHEAGYVQGSWDYATGSVRPAPRRQVLHMAVHSHQTYSYMKPTPDASLLECHRLDMHFSVDLMTGNRSDSAVSALLDDRMELGGLTVIAPIDMFIFTCLHLAREAVHRNEVLALKDLVLYKLVDILALSTGEHCPRIDFDALPARADRLGFAPEVYFALHYTDAVFPGRVPAGLLDRLRPHDLDYLSEVRDGKQVVHRWQGPVVRRMFDIHRLRELGDDLRIPVMGESGSDAVTASIESGATS
ncbi:nucleotidyltransferase family protein [Nocardia sp. NPDC057455]|uniref:nucleotidyltransferase domain-containing protein n=1 Tax=Nocardia sp. NPDC057455 TaxID=3346138 RepID=UPI0036706264